MNRAFVSILAALLGAGGAQAASNPPLSGAWNIQSSGSAESSGELLFRVTPGDTDDDPIEVTVSVLAGSNEIAVARKIQSTLATQLRPDRYNVTLGEGANVLVTDQRGQPTFSLELLTSDVDNVRIAVQSTQPSAAPTVPVQTVPSTIPAQGTPAGAGSALPPAAVPQAPGTSPTPAGANPGTPGANPGTPGANPGTPGANPGTPGANPGTPGANPGTPGTSPNTPGTTSPSPGTPGASPGATPSSPANPAPPPNTTGGAGQPGSAPGGGASAPPG
jgi:hypothetical protein